MPLLDVKELRTQFFTQDGVVKAVDGVSWYVDEGEIRTSPMAKMKAPAIPEEPPRSPQRDSEPRPGAAATRVRVRPTCPVGSKRRHRSAPPARPGAAIGAVKGTH